MGGSSRSGRVVLRSYNNANTQGGVACANANNDSSNTNANNGSRLAIMECPEIYRQGIGNAIAEPHRGSGASPHREGGDRYLVLVEDESAKEFKFFTNSDEMKQILDKVREAGEIPFRTVIRRKTFGEGKKKYCFT